MEEVAREELAELTRDERVLDFRGRGAMLALEFVTENGDPDHELVHKIAAAMKEEGILILTCGLDHNVIRLLPSLAIPDHLWREGLQALIEKFNQFK